MTKFWAICRNTFVQTIRQPIFAVLVVVTFAMLVMTLPLSGWTMSPAGDHKKTDQMLMENLGLSTLLGAGLLIATFSAATALTREIEDHTALTVISKPVPRATFIVGKFAGVAGAVALGVYLCAVVFLMTVRHGVVSAASDPVDWPVIVIGSSALLAAILVAVVGNFLFGWTFASAAAWSSTILLTVGLAAISIIGKGWQRVPFAYEIRPDLLPALLLMFLAVMILTLVAVAASTRLSLIPTLMVCIAVALVGAYHPQLFGDWAGENVVVRALGWAAPNLKYLLMMDALTQGRAIPANFVAWAAGYAGLYIAAVLAVGIALFQTRPLEAPTAASAPGPVNTLALVGRAIAVLLVLAALVVVAWPRFHDVGGLVTSAGLLVGGALGWLVWGGFGRGAPWSYWLVLVLACLVLPTAAGAWALFDLLPLGLRKALGKPPLLAAALTAAPMIAICLLPRTRRHFQQPEPDSLTSRR